MEQNTQDPIIIDINGEQYDDINLTSTQRNSLSNAWGFLAQTMPTHPWIAGVAAILAVTMFGDKSGNLVQVSSIFAITLIVMSATIRWRSHGRSKKTRQSDDVGQDAGQAQGP